MIVKVVVVPNSSELRVEKLNDGSLKVFLTEKPDNNKANIQLIKVLAKFFITNHSNIHIKSGVRGRKKVVEVKS